MCLREHKQCCSNIVRWSCLITVAKCDVRVLHIVSSMRDFNDLQRGVLRPQTSSLNICAKKPKKLIDLLYCDASPLSLQLEIIATRYHSDFYIVLASSSA